MEGVVVDPALLARAGASCDGAHRASRARGCRSGWPSLGAEVTGFAPLGADVAVAVRAGGRRRRRRVGARRRAATADAVARGDPSRAARRSCSTWPRSRSCGSSYEDPAATYDANVMGTAHVLEAARATADVGSVVVVTSDKCYLNREWDRGYREDDPLGGHDPYSASKAAPGAGRRGVRATRTTCRRDRARRQRDRRRRLRRRPPGARRDARGRGPATPLQLRNPDAIRPWQHVLCPLHGYLLLAERGARGRLELRPADEDARPVRWVADRLGLAWEPRPRRPPARGALPEARLDEGAHGARLGAALGARRGPGRDGGVVRRTPRGGDVRAVTLDQIERYSR